MRAVFFSLFLSVLAYAIPASACRYPEEGSDAYFRMEVDRILNRIDSEVVVRGVWHINSDAVARERKYELAMKAKQEEISPSSLAAWSFGNLEVTEVVRGNGFETARVWYLKNFRGICRAFVPQEGLRGKFYLSRSNPASMDSLTIVDFIPDNEN